MKSEISQHLNYLKNKSLYAYGFKNPIREINKMKKIDNPKFDVTPYVGTKTEIVKAEIKQMKFGKVILVETAPIPLKAGSNFPDGKILRASVLLPLIESDDGQIVIAKNSKTDIFMETYKIDSAKIPDDLSVGSLIKEFEGKKVTCQKSETGFLTIA